MMIQIAHRESDDIDIFLDDPQLLGFIDPSRSSLRFDIMPTDYLGDGLRFQKFAFEDVGEIEPAFDVFADRLGIAARSTGDRGHRQALTV